MKQDLKDLIEISRHYGKDKNTVIAGGGNTSMKTADRLWVKASGHALGSIEEDGFVMMDRNKLKIISSKTYSAVPFQRALEIKNDTEASSLTPELRPSVETSLHNLISYKFVVHLHPTLVNGLLCARKTEDHIPGIFSDDALYIPYVEPGYLLFKEVEKQLLKYRQLNNSDPKIILLQNHGIIVGGDSTAEIHKLYDDIFELLGSFALDMALLEEEEADQVTEKILPVLEMKLSERGSKTIRIRKNQLTEQFGASFDAFKKVSKPFTPDNIIYCKSNYLYLDHQGSPEELLAALDRKIDSYLEENVYMPKVMLIKGLGLIANGEDITDAENILDVYENMMQIAWLSESFGGPRHLSPEQIQVIEKWEGEGQA